MQGHVVATHLESEPQLEPIDLSPSPSPNPRLSPNSSERVDLRLTPNSTSPSDQVQEHGVSACGGATLHAAPQQNGYQLLELAGWAPAASHLFVSAPLSLCRGFGLPSSSSLPGGADRGVDCAGDCRSGRGYCYSTPAGLCARCVLWDPDAALGETSCYAHGRPQGGPLPSTREWAAGADGLLPATTCRAAFMPAADTLPPPLCVREVAAEVSLQLIDARSGAEHTAWLPPISRDALSVDPVPAAITQAMCVDSSAPPATDEGRFLALPQPCTLVNAATPEQKLCCAHPNEMPRYNANLTASVVSGSEMFRRLAMAIC